MRSSARGAIVIVCIMGLGGSSPVPDEPERPAAQAVDPATIDDLSWIAGRWVIEGTNQTIEEHWGKPLDNCMSGMLRWSRSGKAWLYEHLIIEETDEGITLYLRHFSPAAKGWEENDKPITAKLTQLDGQRAVFARVPGEKPGIFVYERRDEHEMRVRVGGTPEDQESGDIFVFKLATEE